MNKKAITVFMSALVAISIMAGCGGTSVPVSTSTDSTVSEIKQSSVEKNSVSESSIEINSISLAGSSNLQIGKGECINKLIYIETSDISDCSKEIEIISDNPEIVTVDLVDGDSKSIIEYRIDGISNGTTTIYAQTKDGKLKTDKITVTVTNNKSSEEQSSKSEASKEESSKQEVSKTETSKEESSEAPKQESSEDGSYGLGYYISGTYKAGTDIPAGEYIIYPTENSRSGYYEVCSDSTGDFDSIVSNANFGGQIYLTVSEGQYLTIKRGHAYPVSKANPIDKSSGVLGEGMYKVGTDIPAGEYKLTCTETLKGYLCVYDSSVCSFENIVTNDNFEGNTYITVQNGQYLYINRCVLNLP